ncbi:hypothetical protein ONS95_014786 [Cadophora gregata]|uniref:uncharacterized protein n=1 Tax=Cadophora gregata TaxID=51156 RepID=UPI0026DDC2CD|nr:uncharacterized protein ONS95_014786 [Cadophora gregata]KAK0113080.1 hypothetical protein ONS95_014786 [Cadophora gregata]
MSDTIKVSLPPLIDERVKKLESELKTLEKELEMCDANGTNSKDVLNRISDVLLEYNGLILQYGVTRPTWLQNLATFLGL